jgi:hypothetical protein
VVVGHGAILGLLWRRWNSDVRLGRGHVSRSVDWPPAARAELILRPQLLAAASTVPVLLHASSPLASEQSVQEAHGELEHNPRDSEQYRRNNDQEQYPIRSPSPCLPRLLSRGRLDTGLRCRYLCIASRRLPTTRTEATVLSQLLSTMAAEPILHDTPQVAITETWYMGGP